MHHTNSKFLSNIHKEGELSSTRNCCHPSTMLPTQKSSYSTLVELPYPAPVLPHQQAAGWQMPTTAHPKDLLFLPFSVHRGWKVLLEEAVPSALRNWHCPWLIHPTRSCRSRHTHRE